MKGSLVSATDSTSRDRRGRPPFAHLAPAVALAGAYGVAGLGWALAGDGLPGGRWLAVHLFTLGVVSNLILAMTEHFASTLTRAARDGRSWQRLALFNVGALSVVVGVPLALRAVVVAGAVLATAAVSWLYLTLRQQRRQALGARFAFVVRAYERAAAAFLHGAVLGAVLGAGLVSGEWYGAVRLAHLTVNVLGWAGLVLLATVVFFGPTMLRAKMAPNAQRWAVPALRHGATALTVGVVALIVTGAPGGVGVGARVVAALALAGYATAVTAVCLPVLRSAGRAVPSAHGRMISAVCVWFPLAVWAGVVVLALDEAALLAVLGLMLLIGVLGQAIVASLGYLLPMVGGAGPEARAAARARLDRLPRLRPAVFNLGVVAVVGARLISALTSVGAAPVAAGGWALVGLAVGTTLVLGLSAVLAARRPVLAASAPTG